VVELTYIFKDIVLWMVKKSIYNVMMKEGPWADDNNNGLNEFDEEFLT